MPKTTLKPAQLIGALYDDPVECARLAQLRYVSTDEPGWTRLRKGRGFTYRDHQGVTLADAAVRARIAKLAIPPAWRNVWICTWEDGHLLAVGEDERGRRQYIYHERWRSLRDQLNFYRLLGFGDALPRIRADVAKQLRRDVLDADRVRAAMLRIIDLAGLRVGNEIYAEENDSYGLTTLQRRHVRVEGECVQFRFPAKSNKTAQLSICDPGVADVVEQLLRQRKRRLFTVDGTAIGSDELNSRLAEVTGEHLTAKDFRTWKGTTTVFRQLRKALPAGADAEATVLAAIDTAAGLLNNTRTVARAHYVHPDVVAAYTSGELERFLSHTRLRASRWLDVDERLLLAYLAHALEERAPELSVA